MKFAEWFERWWHVREPFGYDHPDTYEPILEKFIEADKQLEGIKELLDAVNGVKDDKQ